MVGEIECSKCKNGEKQRYAKKIRGKFLCKKCYRENWRRRRNETMLSLPPTPKVSRKGVKYKTRNKITNEVPNIKGSKQERNRRGTDPYLRRDEKSFFYRKFRSEGMDSEQANERIESIVDYLREVIAKMKKQNKSEEEMEDKFREEFARICEEGR